MNSTMAILVWSVNLIVGAGLVALGCLMLRRPDRLWVGVRVPHTPEEAIGVRRANRRTAPWLLLLGAAEVLTGPTALVAGLSPMTQAITGLVILLLAIATVALAALLSR